jgi:hypothetical protein
MRAEGPTLRPELIAATHMTRLLFVHSGAGQWLLGVVAIGFVAFGVFLVASTRHWPIAC